MPGYTAFNTGVEQVATQLVKPTSCAEIGRTAFDDFVGQKSQTLGCTTAAGLNTCKHCMLTTTVHVDKVAFP